MYFGYMPLLIQRGGDSYDDALQKLIKRLKKRQVVMTLDKTRNWWPPQISFIDLISGTFASHVSSPQFRISSEIFWNFESHRRQIVYFTYDSLV